MRIHATPGTPSCPVRTHELGQAYGFQTDRAPHSGDLTLCAYCGVVLVFEEGLSVHRITREEEAALENEERAELDAAQDAWIRRGPMR